MKTHCYETTIKWTGNKGSGTESYRSYERNYTISAAAKQPIPGSSDPTFRGDPARYNPEELLVASLSSCHMLWYLHLCAEAGVIITEYSDTALGKMEENEDGSGKFTEVVLRPRVILADVSKRELAESLHSAAHKMCFIANSCNFSVKHEPVIL
jgi:Predicted redox protein, regulator of disulfide bond formation